MFSNLKSENSSILSSQQALFKQEIKRIEAQLQEQLSSLEKRSHYYEGEQSAIKDLLKNNSEKYKQELDEYVKFFENLKNEETKSIRYDLEKLQREVENSKSKKNEKTSVFSLKEDWNSKFDNLNLKIKEVIETTKDLSSKSEKEISAISNTIKANTEGVNFMQNYFEDLKSNTLKRQDWENQVFQIQQELEKLGKEVLLKANIKDICTLLDIKANIDDVNHALEDLHSELDNKINVDELTEKLKEQSCINEALCAENCLGRWLWKSGDTKSGGIPWEIQSINTCPENFIWEKDKTTVIAITPGLYQVYFGVFSKKKCTLQLLINGEIVICDGSTQGKLLGKHSSGNIVGCTYSDYLSVPSRARISLSYVGDPSEGFLGLKKL